VLAGQREARPAVADQYVRDGFWPGGSITEYFEAAVHARPEHAAVVDGRFGRISYETLAKEVEHLTLALLDLGVSRGDFFIIQLPNWWLFTAFHLALTYLGAITVNVPTTYRHHELRFIARATRAAGIVIPAEFRGIDFTRVIADLRPELPNLQTVIVIGDRAAEGMVPYSAATARGAERRGRGGLSHLPKAWADEVTAVSFTSGTTGEPKGVMHTSNTLAAINVSVARAYHLGPDDVIFMPAPLGHSIGLMHGVRLALILGATLVLQEQWEPGLAIEMMSRERASFTAAAPPFLHDLVHHPLAVRGLASLRVFLCGGAFVSEPLLRAAHAAWPSTLTTALWGMTEGIGTACRAGSPLVKRFTTDGRPFPGTEVRIAAPDGTAAPAGEEGELLMRGPQLFVGYFQRPDLNAAAFLPDGFFRTGDLACMDGDGHVSITGRIKELIVRGGVNISPVEVERALARDPRIERIAIVGIPDERLGERICAFVVPRAGAALTLRELVAVAERQGLSKQKWPERLEQVPELPTTPSGKILRNVLRARVSDQPLRAAHDSGRPGPAEQRQSQ